MMTAYLSRKFLLAWFVLFDLTSHSEYQPYGLCYTREMLSPIELFTRLVE